MPSKKTSAPQTTDNSPPTVSATATPTVVGKIRSITSQIAEVQIESETMPEIFEILTCPEDPDIRLEVFFQSEDISACLILSSHTKLYRGMLLVGTGSELKIPMSPEILGKVINLF